MYIRILTVAPSQLIKSVSDYTDISVSKVAKVIRSYTGVVDKFIWRKS